MPLLNYQLFIFFRKFFSFGQFAEPEALRLAQFHFVFHVENKNSIFRSTSCLPSK